MEHDGGIGGNPQHNADVPHEEANAFWGGFDPDHVLDDLNEADPEGTNKRQLLEVLVKLMDLKESSGWTQDEFTGAFNAALAFASFRMESWVPKTFRDCDRWLKSKIEWSLCNKC